MPPPKMEGRPPTPRPLSSSSSARSSAEMSRKARANAEGEDNPVRCTGRQCQSCTGGAVADCVAICCCPCAVLNCLALAFVKIPYLIGKRWCLGFRRKKKKKKKGREPALAEADDCDGDGDAVTKEGYDCGGADSWFEIGFEEQAIGGRTSEKLEGGGSEAEVWVELCEFDHLSFGRVSFAGIPLPQRQAKLEN